MIKSTRELSQFSSVVAEHTRSVIVMHWDYSYSGSEIVWCKHAVVEALLSILLGYKNSSELHHALRAGSTIECDSLKAITNEQLDKTEQFTDEWIRSTVLSSIHSAIATFQLSPLEITLSAEFQTHNTDIVKSNSKNGGEWQQIALSLTDYKIYPFSYDYSPEKLNRIILDVPVNIYVDVLLSRLNCAYALQQLTTMTEYQPLVGFYQECDFSWGYENQKDSFENIKCLSLRTNAFKYHHELLRVFVMSDPSRQTDFEVWGGDLDWSFIAYLFSSNQSPFERLKNDLPKHVSLGGWDEKTFTSKCADIFIGELGRLPSFRAKPTMLYLPQSYRRLFENEVNGRNILVNMGNYYRYGNNFIHFVDTEFRVWVNFHQNYSHKVDRLLDASYKTRVAAKQGAHQFLAKYDELHPDYERLTTDEFTLRIIDSSQYLDVERHMSYIVPMEALVKKEQECTNECFLKGEYDSICQCHECKQGRRIQQYEKCEQFSFITGSGASTTKLRGPVRVVTPIDISDIESTEDN